MNKKQGDQMQFPLEKRLEKENEFIQPIIPVEMDFIMKWGIRFINSVRDFFICLEIFIMQDHHKKVAKTDSASAMP